METCRFYKNKYPEVGTIVMVKIMEKNEYGYGVKLLEYNNILGFITMSELIKHKMRKKNVVKINDELPLYVLFVDVNKKYINLSKTKLLQENVDQFISNYRFRTNLNKLGVEIYNLSKKYINDITVKDVMSNTIWKLYETYNVDENNNYEQIYNETVRKLDKLDNILECDIISKELSEKLVNNLNLRIVKKNMVSETEIKLMVMSKEGVYAIKHILDIKLDPKYSNFKLDIYTFGTREYKIMLYGPCDNIGSEIIDSIIDTINSRIKQYKTKFTIVSKHKIIKESDMDIKFLSPYETEHIIF
jgi:translation initiation factor 2 subunit 1